MLVEIFAPEILLVVVVAFLALPIWAAIDAAGRPEAAFQRAGISKTLWIVLPIVGIFLCEIVGLVAAVVWFATIRGQVIAATAPDSPAG
jgi:hypothetical protein